MTMRSLAALVHLFWRDGHAKGTLFPLDTNAEETALAVGTDGQVLTADATADGGVSWQDASGGCVPEILVDDVSGEILFDDVTGDILYDDSACVGGGSGSSVSALDDLTDVVLTSPAEGDRLEYDGTQWVNVAPTPGGSAEGQDTAAATIYVATTGNDTTGDGSSGNPYATIGKALSTLHRSLGFVQTIDVADGTYAEALTVDGFVCTGAGKILITGNPTTPANVTITGTASHTASDGVARDITIFLAGPVWVELEGLRVNPASVDTGVWADEGARLLVDRCTVTGTTIARGIVVDNGSSLELQGDISITGFTAKGVVIYRQSRGTSSVAGTLTLTGSGSVAQGFQVTSGSSYAAFSNQASGMHITITGVQIGFQVGLTSTFTHQAPSATLTVDNVSTPSSSAGVQVTDCSTWSLNGTSKTLVLDHLTLGFQLFALSYAEVEGTRTYTNLGGTSSTSANSVYTEL